MSKLINVASFKFRTDTQSPWQELILTGKVDPLNGVPTGGTAGQLLAKASATDYDTVWVNDGLTILSYGNSTWADFIAVYTAQKVVYCRASSNSNPASGSQTRLAFMAYVNNAANPTEVEFQYYRSVNQHTYSQQGDQVYVYKLTKTGGWTVTTRNAFTKIVVGTGLSYSYSNNNGTLTISLDSTPSSAPLVKGTTLQASSWSAMGGDGWFTQTISDSDVTSNSKIDLGVAPPNYDAMKSDRVEYLSAYATSLGGGIEFWLKASDLTALADYYVTYTITNCDASSASPAGTPVVISGGSGGGGVTFNSSTFMTGVVSTYQWDIIGSFDPTTRVAEFDLAFSPAQTIPQSTDICLLHIDQSSELNQLLSGMGVSGYDTSGDVAVSLVADDGLYINNLASAWYDGDNVSLHITCR